MIPASLRELLDKTQGRRQTQWMGRTLWLANEAWGELAVSLQGAQILHFLPTPLLNVPEDARTALPTPLSNASEDTRTASDYMPEDARTALSSPVSNAPEDARKAHESQPDNMNSPSELCPGGWLWVTPTPAALPNTIRGGIPLCWPWFADERGADESADRSGPFHGTARTADWRLDAVDDHEEGVELHLSPETPLHSQLAPRVVIQANAQRLHLELLTEHIGDTPIKLTAALHSYLAVINSYPAVTNSADGNSTDYRVEGLAGARYLDKLKGFSEGIQQGEIGVRGPVDRIFESNRTLVLDDGKRRLLIAKQGSDSTVVWHPGDVLPEDTPASAAPYFLCVEAACTRLDPVWLVPGAQHLLGTTLSCETLEPAR